MSLRTPSVTLVLTLAAGVFAAGADGRGPAGRQRGQPVPGPARRALRRLDAAGVPRSRRRRQRPHHRRRVVLRLRGLPPRRPQRRRHPHAARVPRRGGQRRRRRRRRLRARRRTTRASSIWTPTATIACRAANGAATASPSIGWTRTATAISPAPRWPLPTPSAVDFSSLDSRPQRRDLARRVAAVRGQLRAPRHQPRWTADVDRVRRPPRGRTTAAA